MGVAGHYARVFDVAFAPTDSSLLASASDDDTCKVWRISDSGATQAASFHGHQDSVLRVSWAAAGNLLASGVLPSRKGLHLSPLACMVHSMSGPMCIMQAQIAATLPQLT